MNPVQLRRLFSRVDGGTWGSDLGSGQVNARVVRAADFDYSRLRVAAENTPKRAVSYADMIARGLAFGDLVVEKSGGGDLQPVGRIVQFDLQGAFVPSNFSARLRPTNEHNSRFLCYLLASRYSLGVTRRYVKQTTGIQNLDLSQFLTEKVSVPDVHNQRIIASYLDRETLRLDDLIAKKRRLAALLYERFSTWLDGQIWNTRPSPRIPLMLLSGFGRPIMYGIVLPGPNVDDGVPIVKGGDVARGKLDRDSLCRTTFEIESRYARSRLNAGDLVFAIRGGIGDIAEVPEEVAGSNITQDVARISLGPEIDRRWLFFALQTPTFQSAVAERITGATIRGLNIWDLKRLAVPIPSQAEQSSLANSFEVAWARVERAVDALRQQISVLQERRQALITAAVSGQLDIPGVAA